ncbi:MAG: class I SAM-dependent RNA methyltransferase [bacterium]|nr:class I SAM-dependent RNA methyltransferase [bacterium]
MVITLEYKKNDLVTVTIEDIGSEGEGIGRADGYTLFVKDAVAGDTVQARIVKPKKNYAYARLEKLLKASPFRAEPKCSSYRQCGGCQLQALSYEKQLEFKQNKIRSNLIRIGGFEEALIDRCMEPIIGMDEPWHYRNKAQYPVGTDKDGNVIAGFYAGRTHCIIANTDCILGAKENHIILENVLEYMRENQVSAYDETAGRGLIRHVLIRKGFASGEIMVCLVINGNGGFRPGYREKVSTEERNNDLRDVFRSENGWELRKEEFPTEEERELRKEEQGLRKEKLSTEKAERRQPSEEEYQTVRFLPAQEKLLERLKRIPGMTSISVSINNEKTNVIMGKEIHTLWGSDTISDTIHVRDMGRPGYPLTGRELTFHISPLSFYQVNPVQTEKLYSLALEYAELSGRETVWDLYCGIGTISLFLAGDAKKVFGVEIIPEAVRDAEDNAVRNGITNAEFFTGRAEEVLPAFYTQSAEEAIYPKKLERENQTGRFCSEDVSGEIDLVAEQAGAAAVPGTEDMRHPDVIVVDPPRKGCDAACLNTMLAMRPERIVYVSCDSATLARDLRILCGGGYEIRRVRGVDQFGMTVHVETVVLIQRKDT